MTSRIERMISRHCHQTIVYWGSPAPTGRGGYSFDEPVEIKGRWEARRERVVDDSGVEVFSMAIVYITTDLDVGGYLYLGDLDDLSSSTVGPDDVSLSRRIISFKKSPNKNATGFARRVWLR